MPPKRHHFYTNKTINLLHQDLHPTEEINVTLEEILERSENFPIKFPIDTARCKVLQNIVSKEELESNINSTYPIIHEDVIALCAKFILEKRKGDTAIEKEYYKDMTVLKLINKFLEKRAIVFVGPVDFYTLLDGTKGYGNWEKVGTEEEIFPHFLSNCLSYDEMKLSAFLSISSMTHFVNNGNRRNKGIPEADRTKIQKSGAVIGLIGPRLPKLGVMEHSDIVFSQWKLTSISKLMADFYGVSQINLHRMMCGATSIVGRPGIYFDNEVYRKRLALSFDTLLVEANARGEEKGVFAYVHVVGIGLGVWRISSHQEEVYLNTFIERIEKIGDNLKNISDVRFGYFQADKVGGYANGDVVPLKLHPQMGIKIHFSRDDPHNKLTGEDHSKLLIVTFAWDSNSLPGNEYWDGSLQSSSDPAAACSTQVAELHNYHINPKCSGVNLRVATRNGRVVTYQQHLNNLKSN